MTKKMHQKALFASLFVGAGLLVAGEAGAITQTGQWNNTTFGSFGDLTFNIEIVGTDYTLTMDADGNVFGQADPPPVQFAGSFNPDGSVTIDEQDHPIFGDVSGFLSNAGDLDLTMVPPAQLDIFNMTVQGTITETASSGTYRVNFNDPAGPGNAGPTRQEGIDYADGIFAAQVPEPASLALLGLAGLTLARRRRG